MSHKYKVGEKVFVIKIKWPNNKERTEKVLGKVFTIKHRYSAADALIAYSVEEVERIYFDESELVPAIIADSPLIKALS